MRSSQAFLVLLICALAIPSPGARAQGVPRDAATARGDWATVNGCLQESLDAPRACIGTVAVLCQTRQRGGNRNDVELACNARESAVWRERLDAAVARLRDRLDPDARSRFLAIQHDWETYVGQRCAVMAEVNLSPSSALSASRCDLREFAHRAIDVDSLARSDHPERALTR